MARMDPSGRLITSMIVVAVCAFIVLAAAIAAIMSLERLLGRPIPKLRDSLPVRRNRAFAIVPIFMAASFALVILMMFNKVTFDKITPSDSNPSAWQTPFAILYISVLALAFSGAIGWIIFAALWVTNTGWRLIARYISN